MNDWIGNYKKTFDINFTSQADRCNLLSAQLHTKMWWRQHFSSIQEGSIVTLVGDCVDDICWRALGSASKNNQNCIRLMGKCVLGSQKWLCVPVLYSGQLPYFPNRQEFKWTWKETNNWALRQWALIETYAFQVVYWAFYWVCSSSMKIFSSTLHHNNRPVVQIRVNRLIHGTQSK